MSLGSEGPGNLDDEDQGQQKRPDSARRKIVVEGGRERGKRREAGRKRGGEQEGGRERGDRRFFYFLVLSGPSPAGQCHPLPGFSGQPSQALPELKCFLIHLDAISLISPLSITKTTPVIPVIALLPPPSVFCLSGNGPGVRMSISRRCDRVMPRGPQVCVECHR